MPLLLPFLYDGALQATLIYLLNIDRREIDKGVIFSHFMPYVTRKIR